MLCCTNIHQFLEISAGQICLDSEDEWMLTIGSTADKFHCDTSATLGAQAGNHALSFRMNGSKPCGKPPRRQLKLTSSHHTSCVPLTHQRPRLEWRDTWGRHSGLWKPRGFLSWTIPGSRKGQTLTTFVFLTPWLYLQHYSGCLKTERKRTTPSFTSNPFWFKSTQLSRSTPWSLI